jgi:tetratricopeptide (TPR) repeat protein
MEERGRRLFFSFSFSFSYIILPLQHMLEAIQLQPDVGYSKYMYLGQMSVEQEAIQAFQRGVDIMVSERNQLDPTTDEAKALASKISTALCSMTEIYLTDCCFEPEAEQKCEEYLTHAQQVDPENCEVYQLLASVRLSQQREEEAQQALSTSMELWIHKDIGDSSIPIYDTRLSLVRLLLEMAMFDRAFSVLELLQKENDQVVDLWYLYGWTYYCLGEEEERTEEEKIALWADARECLETAVKVISCFILMTCRVY